MAQELIEQFKEMPQFKDLPQKVLERIADLTVKLEKATLFESLSQPELAAIAQSGKIKLYHRGDVIIHEGDRDRIFYVIVKGQVRVWGQPQDGQRRLYNYHEAGDFFGELIFLNDQPRAATVDVVDDVELVCFDQEGFDRIVQYEQISNYLRNWGQERMRRSNREFVGKHWDEISVVVARKSWVALAQLTFFPLFIILFAWTTMILLGVFGMISFEMVASVLIAITIGMGLWTFWMWEDWRNDDFIVTSKRLIQIERILVPPFPIERHEAPIEKVVDVTARNHGLWTLLFKVHSLEIKTAGAGTIRFPYLDDSERIINEIFHARDLAQTRKNVEERGQIRHALLTEIEHEVQALSPLSSGEQVKVTPEPKGLFKWVDYFIPRIRIVKPDRIIWRKHWIVLIKEVGLPLLFALLAVAWFVAFLVLLPDRVGGLSRYWFLLLPIVAWLVFSGWYIWRYDGWRNDIYIVTDTRIIDIEGSPFHLREETRTEGTFDIIQNIDYSSPNWLARVLRLGRVTISTAAKQEAFTFDLVERPEEVQQEIFKRVTAFKDQKAREEKQRQNAEFTKWFGIYHRSAVQKEG